MVVTEGGSWSNKLAEKEEKKRDKHLWAKEKIMISSDTEYENIS